MTPSNGPRIDVLDVGHGNSTVVSSNNQHLIVDAGPGPHLLEYLRSEGIAEIDTVVLSHADSDHIRGLVALLGARIKINRVLLNSDSIKRSQIWLTLVYDLDCLLGEGTVVEVRTLNAGEDVAGSLDGVRAEVLAPRLRLQLLGPGAVDADGQQITSNSVSAVVRVLVNDHPVALLPGDIDAVGFSHLTSSTHDLAADYLVLPHHGGLGGNAAETATLTEQLCRAVGPKEVFVSNARGGVGNPRPEVIRIARETLPGVKVACTQLSEACSPNTLRESGDLLIAYSGGASRERCCAGTIRLESGGAGGVNRDPGPHDAFVDRFASTALCRQT